MRQALTYFGVALAGAVVGAGLFALFYKPAATEGGREQGTGPAPSNPAPSDGERAGVPQAGPPAPESGDDPDEPVEHASLEAYPNAVVSLAVEELGIRVDVEPDGRTLVARDAGGGKLWRVDVVAEAGEPSIGSPVVRHLASAGGGRIRVVMGKHSYADVDLATGKVSGAGSD